MAHLTGQDLYDKQYDILWELLSSNPELAASAIASKNKALKTTAQNVIGAINEVLAGLKANNTTVQNFDAKVNDALGNTIADATLLENIRKIDTNALKAIYKIYLDLNGDADNPIDISAIGGTVKEAIVNLQISINAINEKILVLNTVKGFQDRLAVNADAPTKFVLQYEPTEEAVLFVINGIDYEEGDDVTVDRASRTLSWQFSAAAGGFDLDNTLEIYAVYDYVRTS